MQARAARSNHSVATRRSGTLPVHSACLNKCQTVSRMLIRPALREDFGQIRDFLLESSDLYPDIDPWWENRVCPVIEQGGRIVLVVDSGKSLEGVFIGKPGNSAKLCTLRLREAARNQGIGRVLVTEGFRLLLASGPASFHVTISEG